MKPRPPVYVVAGELYVNDVRVFGSDSQETSIRDDINRSNPSWDGHFWLVLGPYIVDVSVFRTAYPNSSPPALAQHVKERFGSGRGLLIADQKGLDELGLKYIAHSLLTEEQVTAYFSGARPFFEQAN